MNETDRERIIDRRVQRRLATDRAYRNAESWADQLRREEEIEREEVERLEVEQNERFWADFIGF